MIRQVEKNKERASALQSPHPNGFMTHEPQQPGVSMPGLPHPQIMPPGFEFNDLSCPIPGRVPNENFPEEQLLNCQPNGGDMANPYFNGAYAPNVSGVDPNSIALPVLPLEWNRPLPEFYPPSEPAFPQGLQDLQDNHGPDHAAPAPPSPHRDHNPERRTHQVSLRLSQQALSQAEQQALPQSSQQALSQAAQQALPQSSQQALSQLSQNALPQMQESSFSEPSIDPSFHESSPLAADVPTLSSPAGVSSNGSPDHPSELDANEDSDKGKDPEEPPELWDPLVSMAPEATVYSIPSDYATADNPMTLEQHAQLQQDADFNAQTVPNYAPSGIAGSAAPSADNFIADEYLHLCNCGPNCQCEMCAIHPYNETARSHMREIATFMDSNNGDSGAHSQTQPFYGENFPNAAYSSDANAEFGGVLDDVAGAGFDQLLMNGYDGNDNSANNPDGSLATAGMATQPFAQSNDYFTFEYPFPGSNIDICSNIEGSCRCGDNCACEGCRTHQGHESSSAH
ncbi:MAG: hypothetical protein Q9216_001420 [Gyalolechia sp. 2 TL-2023]